MKKLIEKIDALSSEIEKSDINSNEKINIISKNINDVLENPGNVSFSAHKRLKETLENSIAEFEESHPKIFGAISVVIESLNELGI